MLATVVLSSVRPATELTGEALLVRMDSLVAMESAVQTERLKTVGADKWLLARVHALVLLQVFLEAEALVAQQADERLITVCKKTIYRTTIANGNSKITLVRACVFIFFFFFFIVSRFSGLIVVKGNCGVAVRVLLLLFLPLLSLHFGCLLARKGWTENGSQVLF